MHILLHANAFATFDSATQSPEAALFAQLGSFLRVPPATALRDARVEALQRLRAVHEVNVMRIANATEKEIPADALTHSEFGSVSPHRTLYANAHPDRNFEDRLDAIERAFREGVLSETRCVWVDDFNDDPTDELSNRALAYHSLSPFLNQLTLLAPAPSTGLAGADLARLVGAALSPDSSRPPAPSWGDTDNEAGNPF